MKKIMLKAAKALVTALPVIAMFAVTVSANTIASPCVGQAVPAENLKKYRKF